MLRWLRKRAETGRRAEKLYGSVVTAARQPVFYGMMGVPDTPLGRFELVALHLFLALEGVRATEPGAEALRQRTIEVFVADMDDCMREMGVGDLGVPKKVKRAAATFYERATIYQRDITGVEEDRLAASVERYVFDGARDREEASRKLADYVRTATSALAVEPFETWVQRRCGDTAAGDERFKHRGSNDVTETLDWTEKTTEIPAGGLNRTREATTEDCVLVARALNILGVASLSSRYRIVAISGGAYRLSGSVSARVEQACVVSLEPVGGKVEASFEVEFWPSIEAEDSGEDASILSGSDVELLEHGLIPVGRIVFETLSASLDPYPRKEGAEFSWQDPKSDEPSAANPFAALSKLKDKS